MRSRTPLLTLLLAVTALALPATALADFAHVVAPGESLSSIAAADGITVGELAADNGLSPDTQVVAGSTIEIPPQTAAEAAGVATPVSSVTTTDESETSVTSTSTTTTTEAPAGGYVVQPGDTLSAIAAQNGISVADLAAANAIDPNGVLVSGTSLSIPGASSTSEPASSGAVAQAVINGNQTLAGADNGPYPTAQTLDASTVGQVGAAAGAPSSLTQAVGWQESGFNNDLVSSTGAVGVMQIEPGTWSYINQVLTPGSPLNPSSALDNVKAGALLLKSLMAETGGNASLAAAGYYQGLQSVEQNGMYSDTQQYVNSVLALQSQYGGQ
jgi:LysM repeat protein